MARTTVTLRIDYKEQALSYELTQWAAGKRTLIHRRELPNVRSEYLQAQNARLQRVVAGIQISREAATRKESKTAWPDSPGRAERSGENTLQELGALLARRLLHEEILDEIARLPPGDLELELDERLVHLPWELCHEGQAFLATKFAVGRRVITAQAGARAEQTPRVVEFPLRVLLVIDPTADLAAAAQEGEQLLRLLHKHGELVSCKMIGGRSRSKYDVLNELEEHDIVHYAGHSRYDPKDPEKSGWVLADGVLDVTDFRKLRRPPQLIFSNSCQSGETGSWGTEGAALGIGSRLLLAGVQHYIGTFWVVDDEDSRRFALAFYESLLEGADIGQAMAKARQAVKGPHEGQQLTGLSYVLYGSPTTALLRPETQTQKKIEKEREDQSPEEAQPGITPPPAQARKTNSRKGHRRTTIAGMVITAIAVVSLGLWRLKSAVDVEKMGAMDIQVGAVDVQLKILKQHLSSRDIDDIESRKPSSMFQGDRLDRFHRYTIEFTPNQDAYVYVIQHNEEEDRFGLFPSPCRVVSQHNPVSAGMTVRIPDEGKWLGVLAAEGVETITVIASPTAIMTETKAEELSGEDIDGLFDLAWKNHATIKEFMFCNGEETVDQVDQLRDYLSPPLGTRKRDFQFEREWKCRIKDHSCYPKILCKTHVEKASLSAPPLPDPEKECDGVKPWEESLCHNRPKPSLSSDPLIRAGQTRTCEEKIEDKLRMRAFR